jgi:glycosyltransferase involved in cell wall biosynthesis
MQSRLLYLIGQLSTGGAERQLFYLLHTMDRERYQPVVFVWNRKDMEPYGTRLRALGIPLYSFPADLSGSSKLRAFRRFVFEHKPEVVHSYSFHTNFAAWYGSLGSKGIPIGSIRQDFVSERRRAGKILGRLSACSPMTQICNSIAAKNTVEKFAGFSKPTRIYLVRNRLDIQQFRMHPLPQKGSSSLLAVGRLFPEKRWDRFLRCISSVAAKGLKFSVCLAGDGPLREELESQARHLGVDRLIQFLGISQDIPTLLKDSTFLIHTADSEGSPNVVMEAMACGRAVVATDAGDVPSLIEEGKTGFVVRRGDDATLVERVAQLISDRCLCRRMGEAGRAKAEREFGLDRLVEETLACYRVVGWNDY